MLEDNAWAIEPPEIIELKNKILSKGTPIKDIPDIKINYGIKTGYNKAFIIDEETKNQLIKEDSKNSDIIKPVLRGRDIKKWQINYQNLYLICSKNGINMKKEYPAVYNYLNQEEFKVKKRGRNIENRSDQGDHWTNLRNCVYYQEMDKEKLIYPDISQDLFAVYDNKKHYTNDRCFILTSANNKYNLKSICCLFSSNLFKFIFMLNGALLGKKGFKLAKIYMEQLTIINLTEKETEKLSKLYDKLINLNKNYQKEAIKVENELNKYIYNLYDLTKEEITLIENKLV